MSEEVNPGNAWDVIDEAIGEFNFEPIREKLLELPDGKAFEPIKNLRGLMSSYLNAQKMIGNPQRSLPSLDDPEAMGKLYEHLGVKSSADEYELNTGELELPEDSLKAIKEGVHKAKLTPDQANEVLNVFLNLTRQEIEQQQAQQESSAEEVKQQKITKYGDKLSEVENIVNDFIGNVENESVRNALGSLANTAEGLEFLSKVSAMQQGDDPAGPSERQIPRAAGTPKDQIARLMADPLFRAKYTGAHSYEGQRISQSDHIAAKELLLSLYEADSKQAKV